MKSAERAAGRAGEDEVTRLQRHEAANERHQPVTTASDCRELT